jgi:hypothetical protein
MADVITLPTAAANPPPRIRWRGKYPPVVTKMGPNRARRAEEKRRERLRKIREARELDERADVTSKVLLALSYRARRGEVSGVVLAWEDSDGEQTALICGEFEADRLRAHEAAGRLCEVIDDLCE